MDQVLLYKGKHEIINNKANFYAALFLYKSIHSFFEKRGLGVADMETNDSRIMVYNPDVNYVVAHSLGTTYAIDHYKEEKLPSVEKIVLLDPSEYDSHTINTLKIPVLVFVSSILKRPYNNTVEHPIILDDGHFFHRSLDTIVQKMDEFFAPKT